jgi:hypothetical protein
MKTTIMNSNPLTAFIQLFVAWYFAFVSIINANIIPIILSSIASTMAIINYYYQIKKNKKQ